MAAIFTNYTPYVIVVNITERQTIDHSDINNFKMNPGSIIMQPKERIPQIRLTPQSNIYICSYDCRYLGHFTTAFFSNLPDLNVYIGLVINGKIVMSEQNLVPSDVDFGIARTIDQSDPRLLLMSPYFILLVVIILLICVAIFSKYVYSSWNSIPDH